MECKPEVKKVGLGFSKFKNFPMLNREQPSVHNQMELTANNAEIVNNLKNVYFVERTL